ncbi:TrmH family RNA methyltransferase [Luteipulveratus flavus]|uniref:TrmH family RNA methyltransferase n=1 Tax=Luteipulveratus flavus TaxID=3031728 RepID=A0ABT6C2I6_9MICO|nr:TrmH family RNA methyltransferase [Luteipulveratus sp. YIM 133296]MDF8262851.1 TrmH family RNA methyltransferase [Luteipulveratus sp. YIM 133296]
MRATRVSRRNATFQQWQTLLTNRTKRTRAGEFLVQGVRPITLAAEQGWTIRSFLYVDGARLSQWATGLLDRTAADRYALAPELLQELAEKDEDAPEMLAVVEMPPDDLSRIPAGAGPTLVFDRPSSPGNIGTMIRSIDALGGAGLVVTGHAADPFDPKCVRATTGSFFAVPVVRVGSHADVLTWVARRRDRGETVSVLGTDEGGDATPHETDLTGSDVVVIGNETRGMTAAWRDACDRVLSIPMIGSASSLNAASAATVVLYEAHRQRLTRAGA